MGELGTSANLLRQLAEVEVVRAMYAGEGEFKCTQNDEETLSFLQAVVESSCELSNNEGDQPSNIPTISFCVCLINSQLAGQYVQVAFSMPSGYPAEQPLRTSVECHGSISRLLHERLDVCARDAAVSAVGEEAVVQVLQRVQELVWDLNEAEDESGHEALCDGITKGRHQSLVRQLIWFHHIKSLQKRKKIVEWAAELRLGGLCKPGFPGIIITEGAGDDVAEYVKRLLQLRWQAMQVRGEEHVDCPSGFSLESFRAFPLGMTELGEGAMSEMAATCREAGVESLFLTALKIHR